MAVILSMQDQIHQLNTNMERLIEQIADANTCLLYTSDLAEVMKKLAKDKMLRALSNVAYAKGDYEKEMGPVSYTHLDVYKRQVFVFIQFLSPGEDGIDKSPDLFRCNLNRIQERCV